MGRINILKVTVLPKTIYRLNATSVKLPMVFITELEKKKNFIIYKEHKRPQIIKTIFRKRNEPGRFRLLDFTLYCKPAVVNIVW